MVQHTASIWFTCANSLEGIGRIIAFADRLPLIKFTCDNSLEGIGRVSVTSGKHRGVAVYMCQFLGRTSYSISGGMGSISFTCANFFQGIGSVWHSPVLSGVSGFTCANSFQGIGSRSNGATNGPDSLFTCANSFQGIGSHSSGEWADDPGWVYMCQFLGRNWKEVWN
jgi:hypothetical protein